MDNNRRSMHTCSNAAGSGQRANGNPCLSPGWRSFCLHPAAIYQLLILPAVCVLTVLSLCVHCHHQRSNHWWRIKEHPLKKGEKPTQGVSLPRACPLATVIPVPGGTQDTASPPPALSTEATLNMKKDDKAHSAKAYCLDAENSAANPFSPGCSRPPCGVQAG